MHFNRLTVLVPIFIVLASAAAFAMHFDLFSNGSQGFSFNILHALADNGNDNKNSGNDISDGDTDGDANGEDVPPPPPALPTAPSHTANCNVSTNTATFSWTAPAGATYYTLRVHDTAYPWNGTCTGTGNWCFDNETSTSRAITGLNGNYNSWVHVCNANGCSAAANSESINCAAPVWTTYCTGGNDTNDT
ncbi:MAG: hypothetical protein Q8P36_02835, partial [bacterium]|nr:hypothetical protein [bacterium]